MNAVLKDDAALRSAEFTASCEPGLAIAQMARRLEKPLSTAELLQPQLILADIDFDRLKRTQKAIDLLREHGIEQIPDHSLRELNPPMITVADCQQQLAHAREMVAQFDALRSKRAKA